MRRDGTETAAGTDVSLSGQNMRFEIKRGVKRDGRLLMVGL